MKLRYSLCLLVLLPTLSFSATPSNCVSASVSAGKSGWNQITVKVENKCNAPVNMQNSSLTFKSNLNINTDAWGTFSSLSYPDNTLRVVSKKETVSSYSSAIDLHFPEASWANKTLAPGKSFIMNFGVSGVFTPTNPVVYLAGGTPTPTPTPTPIPTPTPPPANIVGVKGWPNYIAMGAITDSGPTLTTALQSRPVDAIFKYAGLDGRGDAGQILYPIFTLQTLEQANTLTNYYKANGRTNVVKPVMVIYTAEMSYGESVVDFQFDFLVKHYISLIINAQKIQQYKTPSNPYPGSIILNPDLLGKFQQKNLMNDLNVAINKVSLQQALKVAVCYVTKGITTPYGNNLNYEELFKAIRSKETNNWSTKDEWDKYKMQYYTQCTANPVVPATISIPTFSNNFPGWVQSTNWLIRQFAPDVTFGWQENLWAPATSYWTHSNISAANLQAQYVKPTVDAINVATAYSGNYRPDFLVFDKYEMDGFNGAIAAGYFYNARDWTNVLTFIKLMSEGLNNIPIMLWQIPGGHLQVNGDIDNRLNNVSTEPDYFFGNTTSPLTNLKPHIATTPLLQAIYGTTNIMSYLDMNETGGTGYTWQAAHLPLAASSHVFSILWGGGNKTTSVGNFTTDDNGWLAGRIINYYKNPTPLVP